MNTIMLDFSLTGLPSCLINNIQKQFCKAGQTESIVTQIWYAALRHLFSTCRLHAGQRKQKRVRSEMARYLLANKAVEDLSRIWKSTYEVWSENRANKYDELLISSFQEIFKIRI